MRKKVFPFVFPFESTAAKKSASTIVKIVTVKMRNTVFLNAVQKSSE